MRSRWPLAVVLAIGIALAAAPMALRMFTRAPLGGQMIEEFRPFMRAERLDAFEGHLTTVGAAVESLHRTGVGLDHPLVAPLAEQWPDIDAEMTAMLDTIRDNLDNFAAVAALPPFPLFPWFFLAPGLLLAWAAGVGLRATDGNRPVPLATRAVLVAVGLGLAAAPVAFQMFSRAPLGGEMIAEFRPLMTEPRIQRVQGWFLVIGGAEGAMRTDVLARLQAEGRRAIEVRGFVDEWPAMAADMAPMIGAMSDNLDNFAAIAALPPFGLFPWFFMLPGLMVTGLALLPPGRRDDHDGARAADPHAGEPALAGGDRP